MEAGGEPVKYGADEEANGNEDLGDMIVARELQDAVLALAKLCNGKIIGDCPGGILRRDAGLQILERLTYKVEYILSKQRRQRPASRNSRRCRRQACSR
ncbi:hypothetical protein [Aliihoeflea sp. 2WW]|uniref:hypothetical protein n=1 Tax=Aliihoeflea sp. 2WW TaxID=1381123 RepID=UPI0004669583|nr:hypothetical protein [Aliihoeflea sp. 2WW]